MRWLFVSRAHHEEVVALWQRQADAEHANAQALRADVADLTAKLVDALTPKPPAITTTLPALPVERQRDIVLEKIREESGGDPRLAAHYQKLAARLKREGKTPEEIAAEIGWTTESPLGAE